MTSALYFGVIGFASFLTAAFLLWRFPVHTAGVALAVAIVLDCLEIGAQGLDLGVSIYADDIACFILLCAGCVTVVRWRKLPSHGWWYLLALFGLVIFNFVRGVAENGTKPAGNGIRGLSYIILPSIAFMLLRPAFRLDPARVAKCLSLAGLVFAVIAACRWVGVLPLPEWSTQDRFREVARVLMSDYAMVLGQALLAVLYLQIARGFSWWGVMLAGTLGLEVLFLQHRSVWTATFVGLIWFAVRTAGSSKRLWIGSAVGGICFLAIWSAASPSMAARFSTVIGENIEETERSDNTWDWRVKGYEEALNRTFSGSTDEKWLGPPAGRDLSGASTAARFIHDRYVDTVVNYGILGGILFFVWLLFVARSVFASALPGSQARDGRLGKILLQALLLAQLTYFIPYFGALLLGSVLGLLWVASTCTPKATIIHTVVLERGPQVAASVLQTT